MKLKNLKIPYVIWLCIFVITPMLLILYYSLTTKEGNLTLEGYKKIFDPLYLKIFGESFKLATIATVICIIIGYPCAYILSKKEFATKGFLIFLFIAPMWLNSVIRTYSWLTILEYNGLINNFLAYFGVEKVKLLYTNFSITLGMVYNFLPFMILPIYTVLKKMDGSLIEASMDLGATWLQTFIRVILPLSMGGVISGATMVFMPSLTTFFISNILGGGKVTLIGNVIERQFMFTNDWNFGSALSMVLITIIIISMILLPDNSEEKGGIL